MPRKAKSLQVVQPQSQPMMWLCFATNSKWYKIPQIGLQSSVHILPLPERIYFLIAFNMGNIPSAVLFCIIISTFLITYHYSKYIAVHQNQNSSVVWLLIYRSTWNVQLNTCSTLEWRLLLDFASFEKLPVIFIYVALYIQYMSMRKKFNRKLIHCSTETYERHTEDRYRVMGYYFSQNAFARKAIQILFNF